jgi:hypothetical protein
MIYESLFSDEDRSRSIHRDINHTKPRPDLARLRGPSPRPTCDPTLRVTPCSVDRCPNRQRERLSVYIYMSAPTVVSLAMSLALTGSGLHGSAGAPPPRCASVAHTPHAPRPHAGTAPGRAVGPGNAASRSDVTTRCRWLALLLVDCGAGASALCSALDPRARRKIESASSRSGPAL